MMHSPFATRSSVHALLNTLEHERHDRRALLSAFLGELRDLVTDETPPSTRRSLELAERGELTDAEIPTLLEELRACAR